MVMIDAEFRRQEGRFARHGRVAAPGIPAGTTNRPGAAAHTRLEGGTGFRAVGDWERLCRAAGALNVYSPYGNIIILNPNFTLAAAGTTPTVDNLYQGMALDSVTGLYYERARWYSPSLGAWISQDPAGYVNGANTYQFVMGNPVGAADPSGLLFMNWFSYVPVIGPMAQSFDYAAHGQTGLAWMSMGLAAADADPFADIGPGELANAALHKLAADEIAKTAEHAVAKDAADTACKDAAKVGDVGKNAAASGPRSVQDLLDSATRGPVSKSARFSKAGDCPKQIRTSTR